MVREILTHSRLSCFRSCPRKHQLRYEIGLVPDEAEDFSLRVGTAFHAGKEATDLGQDPEQVIRDLGTLDAHDAAMVAAMLAVHGEHYAEQHLEVVATELAFKIPLRNPATGRPTPTWDLEGVIDRLFRLDDKRLAIKDYKTTTEDMSPGSEYWLRLALDQQMSIYVIAARELGYDVQTILYDVTRRPMHRPKKATPVEERKYTAKASKLADGTVRPAGSLYADQRETDETPAEFAARVAEAMRAEPALWFQRHEIARLDRDLDETRAELWMQQLQIRDMQKSGHWWRNPGACVVPYRCQYLSICSQQISPSHVPSGFRLLADVHPELANPGQAGLTKDGSLHG